MNNDKCSHDEGHGTLRQRLMDHLVGTVPEDSAICEFNCSKTECSNDEWTHCQRRLDSLKKDEPADG
ncbi:MAG: hypothetical protein B9S38_11770 [Verrucomicrobiia bacterium Tous-C4TDCM]|jgi:hypothetical protein|nr:MAG: hypothetical protein B9S38_11770 [Verrucomicrobiae bacterium Tous-C4TDCM]